MERFSTSLGHRLYHNSRWVCLLATILKEWHANRLPVRTVRHAIRHLVSGTDVVMVDVDETFFDGRPTLFAVEPISLATCGFHVPSDGDRSSYTWGPLLLILQEDQHLDIYGGAGDAAKPYPNTFKAILERDDRFQEDTFHQLRDLQTLRRKLENGA